MIYCDTAATTPLDPRVLEKMNDVLSEIYGNPSSIHRAGQAARAIIEKSRRTIASILNTETGEIYFTSGGSESNNIVLRGSLRAEDHIITSSIEHPTVLQPAQEMANLGIELTILEPDSNGHIQPSSLKSALKSNTRLVSIMTANNELGTVNDIKTLADISKIGRALFHTDAVQAVGKIPLNLNELNIDFLSASAHKFYGPKGSGFLYMKNGNSLKGIVTGGGQEKGLRAGTENTAGIAGLGKALELACSQINKNLDHIKSLEIRFLSGLNNAGIEFRRNGFNPLPGLFNLTFFGVMGQTLIMNLDLKEIAISFGSACASGTAKPSAILSKIGIPESEAESTVRISFSWHNSEEDIDALTKALAEIIPSIKQKKVHA